MVNRYRKKVLWRDTIREPRLMIFDARLIFFLLLLAVHLALWTFFLLCAAIVVFWLVERAGYRFPSALRAVRATFAGVHRPALYQRNYRQAVDYGFEYRRRESGSAPPIASSSTSRAQRIFRQAGATIDEQPAATFDARSQK